MERQQQQRQLVDFIGLISELGNGATVAQLAEELTEVIDGVKTGGGAGKLTIEIKVKPKNYNRAGEMTSVEIEITPKATLPKVAPPGGIFYIYNDGRVSQQHPDAERQYTMDLNPGEKKAQ